MFQLLNQHDLEPTIIKQILQGELCSLHCALCALCSLLSALCSLFTGYDMLSYRVLNSNRWPQVQHQIERCSRVTHQYVIEHHVIARIPSCNRCILLQENVTCIIYCGTALVVNDSSTATRFTASFDMNMSMYSSAVTSPPNTIHKQRAYRTLASDNRYTQ